MQEGRGESSRSRPGSWLEAGKAKANLMQSSLMQRDGWPKRDDGETTVRRLDDLLRQHVGSVGCSTEQSESFGLTCGAFLSNLHNNYRAGTASASAPVWRAADQPSDELQIAGVFPRAAERRSNGEGAFLLKY